MIPAGRRLDRGPTPRSAGAAHPRGAASRGPRTDATDETYRRRPARTVSIWGASTLMPRPGRSGGSDSSGSNALDHAFELRVSIDASICPPVGVATSDRTARPCSGVVVQLNVLGVEPLDQRRQSELELRPIERVYAGTLSRVRWAKRCRGPRPTVRRRLCSSISTLGLTIFSASRIASRSTSCFASSSMSSRVRRESHRARRPSQSGLDSKSDELGGLLLEGLGLAQPRVPSASPCFAPIGVQPFGVILSSCAPSKMRSRSACAHRRGSARTSSLRDGFLIAVGLAGEVAEVEHHRVARRGLRDRSGG